MLLTTKENKRERPRYVVLTPGKLRLAKIDTMGELMELIEDLQAEGILYEVFENQSDVYSRMKRA